MPLNPEEEARAEAYRQARRNRAAYWLTLRARLDGSPAAAAEVRDNWRPYVLGMRDLNSMRTEPVTDIPDRLRANYP